MRSGNVEKLVIPSSAKFHSFHPLNFVLPATRFCSRIFYDIGSTTNPAQHTLHKQVSFWHELNIFYYFARHEPEVANILFYLRVADFVMKFIEPLSRFTLQPAVSGAVRAFSQNHICTGLPFLYQVRNNFDRVLQINVNRDNCLPGSMVQTCETGRVLCRSYV